MRNFKNNRRRYRSNSYDRNFKNSSNDKSFNTSLSNISDFKKKNFPRNNVNCSKLIQKYTDLAREALSSGDKILSENYFQHADHFMRILNDREIQKKLNLSNSDLPNKEKKFINENSTKINANEKTEKSFNQDETVSK